MEAAAQALGRVVASALAKAGQVQAADQLVDLDRAGAAERESEAGEAPGQDRERGTVPGPGTGQERERELEQGRVVVPAEDRLPE